MGARAKENRVELIVNYSAFKSRVGLITYYYDLEWLGFTGHDFSGSFNPCHLPQLEAFCGHNPDHHIVSSMGPGRFVNKLVQGSRSYRLANKDKDPSLMLNFLLDPEWSLIVEDGISSALAEIHDIKNRRKR
ncbi:MAG: hypothetical protein NTY08_10295 [Proteobacteria bacterium]|nr:hypothetical protein [Pseudomonadota bacterium]